MSERSKNCSIEGRVSETGYNEVVAVFDNEEVIIATGTTRVDAIDSDSETTEYPPNPNAADAGEGRVSIPTE